MTRHHQEGNLSCWCHPYVEIKIVQEHVIGGLTIQHRRIEVNHRDAIGGELDLVDLSIIGGHRDISNN